MVPMRPPVQSQAQLPSERQEVTIEDMMPGDSGWTVPWGMYADPRGALWLNGSYTIHDQPGGTVNMRVWRDEADGYWRVDATACRDRKWPLGGGCYVGRFFRPIPVADAQF